MTLRTAFFAGSGKVGVIELIVAVNTGADSSFESSLGRRITAYTGSVVGAGQTSLRTSCTVGFTNNIVETGDTLTVLSKVSMGRIDTASTGTTGTGTVLARIRTLLAGGSADEVAISTSASQGHVVQLSSSNTGSAL